MATAQNTLYQSSQSAGAPAAPLTSFFAGPAGIVKARRLIILGVILFLEIYGQFFANPAFFRPVSVIIMRLFDTILPDAGIRGAIIAAIYQIAVAYALSVFFGLLLGLAIGWTNLGRRSLFPIVLLLYAIPQVTLLPLFTLIFGLGTGSKIAFGFSHGIFPILVNVIAGMRNVNQLYLSGARSMGASRIEIFRHVIFPHMVPGFFAGLRLGMTLTLLGVILAELYVSTGGIGYYTRVFAETLDPGPLYAIILVLTLIAIAFNELVRIGERRFTRWKG